MREKYKLKLYRGTWCITWVGTGGTKRISTGEKDAAAARRFLNDWILERDKPEAVTVGFIWSKYMDEKEGTPAAKRMRSEWKHLSGPFGEIEPRHVTVDVCRQYTERRRASGIKDGTIWTELGDLATVLTWGVKRTLIDRAPHIERPRKPPPRNRWLTESEIRKLLDAANEPHINLAIQLMLSTAGRIGAILELTWDRVYFDDNSIDLASWDGKRRKGRAHIPMTRSIRAALRVAKTGALTDHVIEWAGRPVGSIKRGFRKAVVDAGLEGVTPHVLRHTAAVHMAKRNVSMEKIAQYLGHEDDRITQRVYARFAPGHMEDAASALDDMLSTGIPERLREVK